MSGTLPPLGFFFLLEKVVFSISKGTSRENRSGKKGGQGRGERVQEMGEMVETVLGMRDGIQVHSSFHTHVKELEYKDLLTRTQGSLSSFFWGID